MNRMHFRRKEKVPIAVAHQTTKRRVVRRSHNYVKSHPQQYFLSIKIRVMKAITLEFPTNTNGIRFNFKCVPS